MSASKHLNSRSSATALACFLARLSTKNSFNTSRDTARDSSTKLRCFSLKVFTKGVNRSKSSSPSSALVEAAAASLAPDFIAATIAFTAAFGTNCALVNIDEHVGHRALTPASAPPSRGAAAAASSAALAHP
jgi:hypothetical protein